MKAIAILVLASLPVPQISHPVAPPKPHFVQQASAQASRKGGKWYLARTGHAVYCYGPVMTLTTVKGEIQRVATFCKGEQVVVPLKD
ncbi:MAG TPA: hypothetical protein VL156_18990 [Terriglobales bacterium]|jgi:hypothetical protein|nr:hypothetical protein [Terriglobales bacterium]